MKKYKSMIILLTVFVALIGLYFAMGAINNQLAGREEEETYTLTAVSALTSMQYTDGETTMSFTKQDGTWTVTNDDTIILDHDSVESIADTLCSLTADRVLEGADELSSYGLDTPAYTITLVDESENTTLIYVGNATDTNYYVTLNDMNIIYVMDSTAVDAMEFDIEELKATEESE